MAEVEKHLLQVLDRDGVIEDSEAFASTSGYSHSGVVSSVKSLQSYEMIIAEVRLSVSLDFGCMLRIWTARQQHDSCYQRPHACMQEKSHSRFVLTAEGMGVREQGSAEFRVHGEVKKHEGGISMKQLQASIAMPVQHECPACITVRLLPACAT